MKTISYFLLYVSLSLNVVAQVIDKKAEAIVNEVAQKIQNLKTMQIDFTYILENTEEKIRETKTGTIQIQGDKYRLSIEDQLVICDGKTIWTYSKAANEVQITNVDPEDETTPVKMITGYNKNFRPKLINETTRGGKLLQIIDLTPNKTQSFYKIRIEVDKNKKLVDSSTIYDKNGTTYTYRIDNFKENPNLSPNIFTFNKKDFPGVTVTDLR